MNSYLQNSDLHIPFETEIDNERARPPHEVSPERSAKDAVAAIWSAHTTELGEAIRKLTQNA